MISYLDMGKEVPYVERLCQIAGLENYLDKTYENVCTVDFICHGVPSAMFFKWRMIEISNIILFLDRVFEKIVGEWRKRVFIKKAKFAGGGKNIWKNISN